VLDVHVSRLRDKLGPHAWMVETVRGSGLRLRTRQ
jgi:DNA-binding response OmpR family regulator